MPRTLDFLSLLALSDAFFGRLFQVIGRIPPFGTVSMTTHFHAAADELAAHGTAPLAAVADANVFHRSFGDQSVALYGAGGQLFATSMQVAYFRFRAARLAGRSRGGARRRAAMLADTVSPSHPRTAPSPLP